MAVVVFAPDSFKGTVSAAAVAQALADGWSEVSPADELHLLPMADGGEGTVDAMAAADPSARRFQLPVTGPDGRAATASWLLQPDGTAVVELASASGLTLLDELAPLTAHTVGLGQVIRAAVESGAQRVLIGLGSSASTDGGTGALHALGGRFLEPSGRGLPLGGAALAGLDRADLSALIGLPPGGAICLVDVSSPLLGEHGAAAVYGPQKGADPSAVLALDAAMIRLAAVLGGDPMAPGMGAAGGTAYGLVAGWGARTEPGAHAIAAAVGLPALLRRADVLVTGEGAFDRTSLRGKVVGTLLDLAGPTPVLVTCGAPSEPVEHPALRGVWSLTDRMGRDAALAEPERGLRAVGRAMARAHGCTDGH